MSSLSGRCFELLKEAARATVARMSMPVRSPGLHRRPKGFLGGEETAEGRKRVGENPHLIRLRSRG
jgi:hypothetical protein